MKKLVLVLAAVFFSQAAFAQDDDYTQAGFPAPPAPAGDMHLDNLKEVKISEATELTTYVESGELSGKSIVNAWSVSNSNVSCSLRSSDVRLSNFKERKRENVGGAGARFTVSPKKSITLKYKSSSMGVVEINPGCNGEPELCEGMKSYYEYHTQIILTDKASNDWRLSCFARFSRELLASDVKINGIKIK